jgi:hypothetical protein
MDLNRRQALLGMAGAAVALDGTRAAASMPRQPDLIRRENQREGTTDWQLTYTRVDPRSRWPHGPDTRVQRITRNLFERMVR